MAESDVMPELKQLLGAMIFAVAKPLSMADMRKCLVEVARADPLVAAFGSIKEADIKQALEQLGDDMKTKFKQGFHLAEVAGGYRLQSDSSCGKWLKHLLEIDRPGRLSRPSLETLAIIAYRQPMSRSEIEAIRGVNVDHIIKSLLGLRLIRIVGRSPLPGRPFLYGTTQSFLEHFGLKDLKDLQGMEPMLLLKDIGARKPVDSGHRPMDGGRKAPADGAAPEESVAGEPAEDETAGTGPTAVSAIADALEQAEKDVAEAGDEDRFDDDEAGDEDDDEGDEFEDDDEDDEEDDEDDDEDEDDEKEE